MVARLASTLLAGTALSGCAGNPSAGVYPTPAAASPGARVVPGPPASMTAPAAGALAVVPVHVTYVLRALMPSLDSLFPARDSLTAARCANAAGLVCHQYVHGR